MEEILKHSGSSLFFIQLSHLENSEVCVPRRSGAWREFHISRDARLKYQFHESLFQSNGNVIFANFHAARIFAQLMNEKRDVIRLPEQSVRAGQLNAMGLIDEILHYVIQLYREQEKTGYSSPGTAVAE